MPLRLNNSVNKRRISPGCTSRTLIVGDEDMAEFDALVAEFTREYRPRIKFAQTLGRRRRPLALVLPPQQ